MSRIRADRLTDKAGTGAPLFPNGISVVGLTSLSNVVAGIATFTSDVSIGGTLTYEDVTNIDSVGLVTARTGVRVTAGGIVVTAGVSTLAAVSATSYSGDGSGLTGMASTDKVSTATLNVSGISTFASQVSGITAMGANAVDCSTANYFTKTITGATTFTFTNVPTGVAYGMTMEVTLNGSIAITWPASVKWPADTAPTITDGKTQMFIFVTDDGGTRWRGSSLVDYTN